MARFARRTVARFIDVPLEAVEPFHARVQLRDGRMTTALYRIRGDSDAVLVTVADDSPETEEEITWVLESAVMQLAA